MTVCFLMPINLRDTDILEYHVDQRNDPSIMRWCRQHTKITLEHHREYLEKCQKGNTHRFFNVMGMNEYYDDIRDAPVVGMAGLTDIDHLHRRAEFSLWIGIGYQSRGYGYEALKELFRYGFDSLNLNMIWGETFDGNPAARMFEKKLGMVYEGTRRNFYFKNGEYVDAHLYSITRGEFANHGG